MWSDIDYLETYRDFTHDPVRFWDLPAFINDLHANKSMHYVPIIDAGVARRPWGNYSAYLDGSKAGAFIKIGDEEFIGQVWPNDAVFPDWLVEAGQTFWKNGLTSMHNEMAFDGLWEDMNEASNFCDGVCYQSQQPETSVVSKLKYVPGDRLFPQHAVSLDAVHGDGQLELDTHNLLGFSEVRTTAAWYADRKERPFIISRSTFAGQGKFGSHWLGDNQANETHMGEQVIGIMMMNLFGIPVSGADICGFGGNTTAELCARWTVVGSFSPFSRNHNGFGFMSQEPYTYQF
jgi:alpha-glucosidase (family GH31 glycosyl hydrolase)